MLWGSGGCVGGCVAYSILWSAPVPLGFWVLELIWTWLGLGLGGLGNKGSGTGLDNQATPTPKIDEFFTQSP